MLLLTAN